MAYKLQVRCENNKYKTINISKSSRFIPDNSIKTGTDTLEYSLECIDRFTTQFDNERNLRTHLVTEGLLTYDLLSAPFVIRFATNSNARDYSLLFIDDLEYIYEPQNLEKLFDDRLLCNDFKFLKAYAECFCNSKNPRIKSMAGELYRYADESLRLGIASYGLREIDRNGYNAVQRLTKSLIYVMNNNGTKLNFRIMHILIEFIKNYDRRESQLNSLNSSKPNVKTLDKNSGNKQLEGQLSFGDL